jgi:hypothetical protein
MYGNKKKLDDKNVFTDFFLFKLRSKSTPAFTRIRNTDLDRNPATYVNANLCRSGSATLSAPVPTWYNTFYSVAVVHAWCPSRDF